MAVSTEKMSWILSYRPTFAEPKTPRDVMDEAQHNVFLMGIEALTASDVGIEDEVMLSRLKAIWVLEAQSLYEARMAWSIEYSRITDLIIPQQMKRIAPLLMRSGINNIETIKPILITPFETLDKLFLTLFYPIDSKLVNSIINEENIWLENLEKSIRKYVHSLSAPNQDASFRGIVAISQNMVREQVIYMRNRTSMLYDHHLLAMLPEYSDFYNVNAVTATLGQIEQNVSGVDSCIYLDPLQKERLKTLHRQYISLYNTFLTNAANTRQYMATQLPKGLTYEECYRKAFYALSKKHTNFLDTYLPYLCLQMMRYPDMRGTLLYAVNHNVLPRVNQCVKLTDKDKSGDVFSLNLFASRFVNCDRVPSSVYDRVTAALATLHPNENQSNITPQADPRQLTVEAIRTLGEELQCASFVATTFEIYKVGPYPTPDEPYDQTAAVEAFYVILKSAKTIEELSVLVTCAVASINRHRNIITDNIMRQQNTHTWQRVFLDARAKAVNMLDEKMKSNEPLSVARLQVYSEKLPIFTRNESTGWFGFSMLGSNDAKAKVNEHITRAKLKLN